MISGPLIYASLPTYVRLGVVIDVRGDNSAVRIAPTLVSFDPDQSSVCTPYHTRSEELGEPCGWNHLFASFFHRKDRTFREVAADRF